MNQERPYVTKRNGQHELYNYNAVQERLDQLCAIEPAISVTTEWIATKVFEGLTPGIRTSELDVAACEAAMAMVDVHPDYRILAGRLLIGNLHPVTPKTWSEFVDVCANHYNAHAKKPAPLLRKKFVDFTKEHKERLDAVVDPLSDYSMDALSVRTFLKSYAIRSYDGTVLERPSYMYMRAAIETSDFDIDVAIETYRMLVAKLFTFATPTLCNSGFEYNQLASCFLISVPEDSIPSIFDTVKNVALCSKFGGGVGLSIHKVRARNSYIASTNGKSNGITEMLKVFNNVARYVDQCFAPETQVLAEGGRWIPIKDVISGETKLMTTKGTYQLVNNVRSYDNKMIGSSCLRIQTSANPGKLTTVTESHPLMVLRYKDGSRHTKDNRPALPDVLKVEWAEAKHLAVGDLIMWNEPGATEGLVAVGANMYTEVLSVEGGVAYDGLLYDLDMSDSSYPSYLTEIGFAHNGGGKRKGSFSIYLEPWHADFMDFLELKDQKSTLGRNVADDLFYATWVPDLFWKRATTNGTWSFFCPDQARGLEDVSGEEFERLYEQYEREGLARKTLKAVDVLNAIVESQKRTGGPSILSKDQCNFKSNQKHSGPIYSSNLCTEIVLLTNKDEVAVCNLSSISLKAFADKVNSSINLPALEKVVRQIVKALNVVIDNQYYAIPQARYSNLRHRPIAIGVQGLQDLFFELRLPFESEAAARVNRVVFEALYFYALRESCDLAKKYGYYETFPGSPASNGILQFHLWGIEPNRVLFAWDELIEDIKKYGLRNCQVIGLMPTASTSALMGNTESFEPIQANFFTRGTLAGENTIVNSYMVKDLMALNMWTPEIRAQIMRDRGSVQNLDIPAELRELYKHAYEVKVKTVIDLAADRGAFVDHSQSMNLFMYDPTSTMVSKALLYGHKKQLKTQLYYLRSKTAGAAQQFAVKQQPRVQPQPAVRNFFGAEPTPQVSVEEAEADFVCTRQEGCFSCGS
jgi:ribonucleoside-diphosphate reductase alpha subunit